MELLATTTFGLEAVVSRELRGLGYEQQRVEDGRVIFEGDWRGICRSNLWLGGDGERGARGGGEGVRSLRKGNVEMPYVRGCQE
jgi:hypothetical protein